MENPPAFPRGGTLDPTNPTAKPQEGMTLLDAFAIGVPSYTEDEAAARLARALNKKPEEINFIDILEFMARDRYLKAAVMLRIREEFITPKNASQDKTTQTPPPTPPQDPQDIRRRP